MARCEAWKKDHEVGAAGGGPPSGLAAHSVEPALIRLQRCTTVDGLLVGGYPPPPEPEQPAPARIRP